MPTESDKNLYTNIPRLSDEEIEELWNQYLTNKDNKKVRDQLIVQYIYLTRYVVGRMKVSLPQSFAIEDIAHYGVEGLIDAVEKFSPDKGARFETYAIMRIRGNIIDRIRSEDWVPRHTRKQLKDISVATEALKQKLGRAPNLEEIASFLNIDKIKLENILNQSQTVCSIYDKKGMSDDSIEVIDTIEDANSEDPLEKMEENDSKKELQLALRRLPERERMIMVLYYHENYTLKLIGETLELSESRVCQLHSQAIMKLRNILTKTKSSRLKKSIV